MVADGRHALAPPPHRTDRHEIPARGAGRGGRLVVDRRRHTGRGRHASSGRQRSAAGAGGEQPRDVEPERDASPGAGGRGAASGVGRVVARDAREGLRDPPASDGHAGAQQRPGAAGGAAPGRRARRRSGSSAASTPTTAPTSPSIADDMPINLVSHAHGQGYADLNFLIPEMIDRVELVQGTVLPAVRRLRHRRRAQADHQGRVQGELRARRGRIVRHQRYVARRVAARLGNVKTLFAGQAYYTNGPFIHPENLARYNGQGQDHRRAHVGLEAVGHGCRATPPTGTGRGRSRRGSCRPACSTASAPIDPTEGGRTDRENLLLDWRYTPTPSDTWEVHGYGTRYKLRLWSDFTFFANSGLRFVQYPNGGIEDTGDGPVRPNAKYIPGDGSTRATRAVVFGGRARYTRNWFLASIPQQSQLALETRNDDIHVTLQRPVRRTSFFTVNDVVRPGALVQRLLGAADLLHRLAPLRGRPARRLLHLRRRTTGCRARAPIRTSIGVPERLAPPPACRVRRRT